MSLPQTVQGIPMAAPTGGLNLKDPLVALDSLYSPWLVNWTPEARYLATRKPFKIHQVPVAAPGYIIGLGAWHGATPKLFALVQEGAANKTEIWDVTGTPSRVVGPMATGTSDECYPAYYNGQLALMTEYESEIYYYNGSTWTQLGFTNAGNPVSGRTNVSYKGRLYIFVGQTCYYTDTVGAVTGSTTSVAFSDILESSQGIWWAGVLSSPGDRASEIYLAFGTADGEVLVYGGDYPAAANWALVGRYKISPVFPYNSILTYRNDIWILTKTGIVSLRDLMAKGSIAAEELTVSSNIDPYWIDIVSRLSIGAQMQVRAAFWPEENKIYILIPGTLTYYQGARTFATDGATILVYNCLTQAWGIYTLDGVQGTAIGGLTYFNNGLYFWTGDGSSSVTSKVMKMNTAATGAAAYQDEDYLSAGTYIPFALSMESAPLDLKQQRHVVGFEPTLYSQETGANFNCRAIADLGRQSSETANVALKAGFSIPHYSCGVYGRHIQYRLEGNPAASHNNPGGIQVYSVEALVK